MGVKNRIIKTAAEMNTHDPVDAHMNQSTIDYVEAVAKGGAGMVILCNAHIDYPLGARMPDGLRIDSDEYIPGFKTGECRTLVSALLNRLFSFSNGRP
jgi:2,4-dienoyl-CoA reductase-like NADH-dependent reductase (Old Yellow Enzyme family)